MKDSLCELKRRSVPECLPRWAWPELDSCCLDNSVDFCAFSTSDWPKYVQLLFFLIFLWNGLWSAFTRKWFITGVTFQEESITAFIRVVNVSLCVSEQYNAPWSQQLRLPLLTLAFFHNSMSLVHVGLFALYYFLRPSLYFLLVNTHKMKCFSGVDVYLCLFVIGVFAQFYLYLWSFFLLSRVSQSTQKNYSFQIGFAGVYSP